MGTCFVSRAVAVGIGSALGGKYLSFAVGRPREVAMPVVCAGQMGPPYSLFVWTIARLYASALLSLGCIPTFFIFQNKTKTHKTLALLLPPL